MISKVRLKKTKCHTPGLPCIRDGVSQDSGASSIRRRAVISAPIALVPLLLGEVSQAAADLEKFTPMDALRDKDYGKPRVRYCCDILHFKACELQDIPTTE